MTNEELHNIISIDRSKLPPDGRPDYNRLIFSDSPYLLQHARNPVDWREWGDGAKQEAKSRNLPLFVSIGYSTCHWCHVMAHESFEDEDVADILNHAFIPVKVDREERPDLDEFCMSACQTFTGSGGWPLNCFLEPDGTPFYALTYLPREPRNGMPGFMELLENLAYVWRQKPDAVGRNAKALMDALQKNGEHGSNKNKSGNLKLVDRSAVNTLAKIYDRTDKGFGNAPKFPMPVYLLFLLGRDNPEEQLMALESLKAMRRGGIWDQAGGGIHRYSTDRRWFAPHFEKMLYDQALVSYSALEAFSITKDSFFLEMANNIIDFCIESLQSPVGGFYCGLDADSEGEEGLCYLWKLSELEQILGKNAAMLADYYGVKPEGNFEDNGENILYQAVSIEELARSHGLGVEDAETRLAESNKRLLEIRNKRIQPLLDLKILCGWNGLMVAALARGSAITGNKLWSDKALACNEFIMRTMIRKDGRLARSYMQATSKTSGFIEDYSYLTWGLLELFKATGSAVYLAEAERFTRETLRLFQLPDNRLLFSGKDAEQMPLPLANIHDGVIPSGVSVFLRNMVMLAKETGEEEWLKTAEKTALVYEDSIIRNPVSSLFLVKTCMSFIK